MWGCRPMYKVTSKSSTFAEAFQVCLRTKMQTGQLQSTLLRTGRIAELDVTIAAVLNDLLRELGVLDNGLPVPERIVVGQVVSSTQQRIPSVAMTAIHMDGAHAIRLGEDNTDVEGHY